MSGLGTISGGLASRVSWGLVALLGACSGGGSAAETGAAVDYGAELRLLRIGEAVSIAPQARPAAELELTIEPDLPAGLAFDPATGGIIGTATGERAPTRFVVGGLAGGRPLASVAALDLAVGAALPAEIVALEPGYRAERFAVLAQPPAKFAVAPDGRVFVGELLTGALRIFAADGTLQPQRFAQLTVANGGHRGMLGVALSPDFAADRQVFAYAVVAAGAGDAVVGQLWRWTERDGVGTAPVLLRDGLPAGGLNNGGALCFDATGMLLVSVGDTDVPSRAQLDGDLAGRILRFDPRDGSVPGDNPDPASVVLCKGLRNVFALAVDPATGFVFGADNGPAVDDELLLVQAGKNYEWGADGRTFGAATGPVLRHWRDVVVPTGLAFRPTGDGVATDWPEQDATALLGSFYDEEVVERFELSGVGRTDIDAETVFLRFAIQSNQNKPLDLQFDPAGRLWVLTQTALFRIDRQRW